MERAVVLAPSPSSSAAARAGGRSLVAALLLTLVLWNIPYGGYLLYPFKIFGTWIHEGCHGLVMLVTGAGFRRMEIFRDTSGLAFPGAGVTAAAQAAISSAGYMGTPLCGAALLVFGRTPRGARRLLASLAALLFLSAGLWVRNPFGIVAVLAFGVLLAGFAWRATTPVAAFLIDFLAAQACINAVLDIRVLFGPTLVVNGHPHGQSDAHTVARILGGPHWLWAALWLTWSFALFFAALRWTRLRYDKGMSES